MVRNLTMTDLGAELPAALDLYDREVRTAQAQARQELDKLLQTDQELQQVDSLLAELPGALRREVLVPFGSQAFFPGELVHTNELMVQLGSEYFVRCTAPTARQILQRRRSASGAAAARLQQQLDALQARLDVAASSLSNESGDPMREIRESVEDSDAWLAGAGAGGSMQLDAIAEEEEEEGGDSEGPPDAHPPADAPPAEGDWFARDMALLAAMMAREEQEAAAGAGRQQQHRQQQAGRRRDVLQAAASGSGSDTGSDEDRAPDRAPQASPGGLTRP
jgi:unconventional prefoldin RPB5 interactor 1